MHYFFFVYLTGDTIVHWWVAEFIPNKLGIKKLHGSHLCCGQTTMCCLFLSNKWSEPHSLLHCCRPPSNYYHKRLWTVNSVLIDSQTDTNGILSDYKLRQTKQVRQWLWLERRIKTVFEEIAKFVPLWVAVPDVSWLYLVAAYTTFDSTWFSDAGLLLRFAFGWKLSAA